MAYWLYCQSCQQWSKSATPLSGDKVCPFCSHLLMKVKGKTNTVEEGGSADRTEEAAPQPVAAAVPAVKDAPPEETSQDAAEAKGVSEPVEVTAVLDQPVNEKAERDNEEAEEPETEAEPQDTPPEDSLEEAAEEEAAVCEDQDDLIDEDEAGEEKNPEPDNVKISEVRVITDKNEKKERLAKKVHR